MSFVWYLHEKHSLCNFMLSDITRIESNQIQLITYSNTNDLYY